MSVSAVPNITPALTFRPLSPMLARMIDYANSERAEANLHPAPDAPTAAEPHAVSAGASSPGLDLRA